LDLEEEDLKQRLDLDKDERINVQNMNEETPSLGENQEATQSMNIPPSGVVICKDASLGGMKRVHKIENSDLI
jgi:hypothetical protein